MSGLISEIALDEKPLAGALVVVLKATTVVVPRLNVR